MSSQQSSVGRGPFADVEPSGVGRTAACPDNSRNHNDAQPAHRAFTSWRCGTHSTGSSCCMSHRSTSSDKNRQHRRPPILKPRRRPARASLRIVPSLHRARSAASLTVNHGVSIGGPGTRDDAGPRASSAIGQASCWFLAPRSGLTLLTARVIRQLLPQHARSPLDHRQRLLYTVVLSAAT